MQQFSPTESALEGFRLAREHPLLVAILAVFSFATTLILYWVLIKTIGPQVTAFMNSVMAGMGDPGRPPSAEEQALVQQIVLATPKIDSIVIPVFLLFQAVQSAAIMRVVLRRQRPAGYLGAGGDELRSLAVIAAKALGFAMVWTLALLLVGSTGPIGAVIGMLLVPALLCASIYVSVRLSLAVPQSIAERRIAIVDSWRLTQGLFWPTLGCYLLAAILWLAVNIFGGIIIGYGMQAIAAASGMAPPGAVPDMTTPAAYFTPVRLIGMAVTSVISGLSVLILYAPAAMIYRQLKGEADIF